MSIASSLAKSLTGFIEFFEFPTILNNDAFVNTVVGKNWRNHWSKK